jgi:hypothetical protein
MAIRSLKVAARYFAAFAFLASARRSAFFRRLARFLALSLPLLFPISSNLRALVAMWQWSDIEGKVARESNERVSNRTKPRPGSALLLLLLLRSRRRLRRRILNFFHLERPKERSQIDYVVRG